MRRLGLVVALLAGCGGGTGDGDASAGLDAATECGPSPCGACGPGTRNDDRCVGGAWVCDCVPIDAGATDAGEPDDAGASDAGALDAGALDAGEADAGAPDAGGPDAGDVDAGGLVDAGGSDAGTASCMVDGDCPSGAFCRATMAGGRECHPYSREGERCGGFVPPWAETRCVPGTSCVAGNPLIADAPGTCALPVTVADLLASPSRFDGHVVAVLTGWIVGGPAACTRRACPMTMPCCNTCNSGELLADAMGATMGVSLRDMASVPYACSGDECMPYTTCTQPVDRRYRVIGRFVAAMGGYLEVQSISMIP